MCSGMSFTSIFAKTSISLFFNCRIEAYKNLMHELFLEKFTETTNSKSITDNTPQAKHCEENIMEMCSLIITNKLLDEQSTNRGLLNVFTGQNVTPEQVNDMLSCRKIGLQSFQQYVTYRILQKPSSVNAPLRHHKLLTMLSVK